MKRRAAMRKLYCLTFYAQPNDDYREGFYIGLFWTYDKAKGVEMFYRNEIPGFKDYQCDAEITEVKFLLQNFIEKLTLKLSCVII